ncbi:PREDICTED: uncharacterized protein LOC109125994 [Camelina sativa]|uniref:Uncharacterized protein LOC109125994 n=1 Tax=Camelina sativa TaxID=90675 RepID=A0ABM1QCD4_CAMSA|nr:PREDICTED: uncharacterized protein LOC109125994 [Camelina sativa]
MLQACQMEELSSKGNGFTWAGRRYDLWIQSKLDRVFGNKQWFSQFPASNQSFLEFRGSDHRPVLMKLLSSQEAYRGQFRFDKKFLHKPEVEAEVIKAWNSSSSRLGTTTSDRIRICRKALSTWKKENNSNAKDKIHQVENALEKEQSLSLPDLEHVGFLKRELSRAYRDEETYWSQRSREKWMRCGDRNTKFFQASVKGNRSKKRIEKLKDINGYEQFSEAAKGEVACAYFQNLFTSSNPSSFETWF